MVRVITREPFTIVTLPNIQTSQSLVIIDTHTYIQRRKTIHHEKIVLIKELNRRKLFESNTYRDAHTHELHDKPQIRFSTKHL